MKELPIIQKTYDLIKWYVPILDRLPKNHKFTLGERMINRLYNILEELIKARFIKQKIEILNGINIQLDILRYQTRLLHDYKLINTKRYEYINQLVKEIGIDLGAWIKEQQIRKRR